MKSPRLITLVAFSALAACSNMSDSDFRGDHEPLCEGDGAPLEVTTTSLELWPPNHDMQLVAVADCAEIVSCDPEVSVEILWVSSDEPAESAHDDDACDDDDHDDDDDDDGDDDDDDKDHDDDGTGTGTSTTSGGDEDEGGGTTGDLGTTGEDGTTGDDKETTGVSEIELETTGETPDDGGAVSSSEDIAFVGPDLVELRAEREGGGNGRVYTIAFVVRDTSGHELESSCTVTVPANQGNGGDAIDDGEAYRVEP